MIDTLNENDYTELIHCVSILCYANGQDVTLCSSISFYI